QLRRLARARPDRLDLAGLVREQIELALALSRGLLQVGGGRSNVAQPSVGLPVGGERAEVSVARGAVEERGLRLVLEEPQRAVLAVDLDQPGPELRERRRRGELAADPPTALPVGPERAREDHLAILGPRLRTLGRVEAGLDLRGAAPAYELRAGAGAGHQRQRHRDHRLAGAGLAGEDGQAGRRLEVEIVDDPETADVQLAEHARILATATDISGSRIAGQVELLADPGQEARAGR